MILLGVSAIFTLLVVSALLAIGWADNDHDMPDDLYKKFTTRD